VVSFCLGWEGKWVRLVFCWWGSQRASPGLDGRELHAGSIVDRGKGVAGGKACVFNEQLRNVGVTGGGGTRGIPGVARIAPLRHVERKALRHDFGDPRHRDGGRRAMRLKELGFADTVPGFPGRVSPLRAHDLLVAQVGYSLGPPIGVKLSAAGPIAGGFRNSYRPF
jgi:hypothetical protein